MKKKSKVLYYCHTAANEDMNKIEIQSPAHMQFRILDNNDRDVMLDHFGIEEENELIKFVVHIMLRK